ncbi:MAG: hypothetical protein ACR2N6_09640 [Miltoncostaeaceae bacterium]
MTGDPANGAGRARESHRSRERSRVVLSIVAAVVGLLFLLVFGGVGLAVGQTGLVVVGVVIAGVAWYAAWSQYRRARPVALPVEVQVEPQDLGRGGRIEVVVAPAAGVEGAQPIEVGLICTEWYTIVTRRNDNWRHEKREAREIEDWRAIDSAAGGVVMFDVPPTAPYSYSGECLSYAWRVEAKRPSTLRTDPRAVVPIWVRPA